MSQNFPKEDNRACAFEKSSADASPGGGNKDYKIEKQHLQAELTISQAKVRRLNAENNKLKIEISNLHRTRLEESQNYKRRLNMLKKASELKSSPSNIDANFDGSPLSQHLTQRPEQFVRGAIEPRHAFKAAIDLSKINTLVELEKLRFFRDYFFDDFFSIDSEAVIQAMQSKCMMHPLFMEAFKLFCCKKPIFDEFCVYALGLSHCLPEQLYIVESVPVNWICESISKREEREISEAISRDKISNCRHSCVFQFVLKNSRRLLELFSNIAETNSSLLDSVLLQDTFDYALKLDNPSARRLVSLICKQGGLGYITEKNLYLLTTQNLADCFGESCI